MRTVRKRDWIKSQAPGSSAPYFKLLSRERQAEAIAKLSASMAVGDIASMVGVLRADVVAIAEYHEREMP